MRWLKIHNSPGLTEKRKYLRVHETVAEKILWNKLRNRQLNDCKFKRQHSVGGYILDFYCSSRRLAIELDGFHHLKKEKIKYDNARTEYLQSNNIRVIRFMNYEVTTDIQSVINRIQSQL